MGRSILNPKPSDYAGRYRLAALAVGCGAAGALLGAQAGSELLATLLVSGGIGLLIGGAATAVSAWRSQERARRARDS